jgi:hypothetical protein
MCTSMGQRGDECWAEIWDVCGLLERRVVTTGESTWSADLPTRRRPDRLTTR